MVFFSLCCENAKFFQVLGLDGRLRRSVSRLVFWSNLPKRMAGFAVTVSRLKCTTTIKQSDLRVAR